jgi:hypothetical protein
MEIGAFNEIRIFFILNMVFGKQLFCEMFEKSSFGGR